MLASKYDKEFKVNTVKLVLEEGKVAAQVSRDLGISEKARRPWLKSCRRVG